MSTYIVKTEEKITLKSNLEDFLKIINLLDKNDILEIDLSNVKFIKPESLIVLVTASELAYKKTCKPVVWKELNSDITSYLERIDVNKLPFISLKKKSQNQKYYRSSKQSENLVELAVITDWKKIGEAIQKTRGVINRWLPEKSLSYRGDLITLLKETVENSVDHSGEHPKEGVCYYVVQKYVYEGNVDIQIAVGDTGVGMLNSLKRVYKDTKDDVEAIWGALVDGKSGRKTGGGLGYYTIKEALSGLKGSLTIRSGTGLLKYNPSYNKPYIYRKKTKYPGTQIIFHCKG